MRRAAATAAGWLWGLALSWSCLGADEGGAFPSKAIKVIVPFSPGGGSDTFARMVQREIRDQELLSHPVVIQNVPGAGGTIGSRHAKNAFPDGHTLLFLHDGIHTARHSGQATYGAEAFEPIAVTGRVEAVIAVAEDSHFASLGDLLEEAAARPREVTFAANMGAPSHFMALLVEKAHGEAAFRFVQSGGGAKRFGELKGGHVVASAFSVAEYLVFREGGLQALAILSEERNPALPDLSTAREQGIEAIYANLHGWWAPRGTPATAITTMQGVLSEVMRSDTVRSTLAEQHIDPLYLENAEMEKTMRELSEKLGQVASERSYQKLPDLAVFFLVIAIASGTGCLLIGGFHRREKKKDSTGLGHRPNRVKSLLVSLLGMLVFLGLVILLPLPFFLVAGCFLAVAFFWFARQSPLRAILQAGAFAGLLHLIFVVMLGIDLP